MTIGSFSAAQLSGLTTALADRYRLERELGAGGMATVWLAHDLRHQRRVAIKVLHPELSAVLGPERFLAEIRTTANLNHPNILPLFDSGSAEGLLYYVMPLVEGETLRARLTRERQLPIAETVRLATEVADALEYAHRRGIIHRDVKPENILLQDGHALVADFGIALAVSHAGGARMTQTGLSLGTPAYMAPEQAAGERAVDVRADVYALGVVTYEMLAGVTPFTGPTGQSIVARVMTEEPPPLSRHRPSVPEHVEDAVSTALEKIPADRFASAAEFRDALRDAAAAPRRTRRGRERARTRRWPALAGVALLAAALLAGGVWLARPARAPQRVIRFSVPVPPNFNSLAVRLAISRDGRALAYVDPEPGDRGGIYVRALDRAEPELIAGTADARTLTFSPDGSSLAFLTPAREVRVVPRAGGAPVTVAQGADWYQGIDWGDDGYLYFIGVDSEAVSRVPAGGGAVEIVGILEDSSAARPALGFRAQRNPRVLRGGRAVLFSIWRGPGVDGDVGAVDLRTRKTRLVAKGRYVVGVRDGHLLVISADGVLRAIPFDEDRLAVGGAAIPLLPNVTTEEGSAQIALADDGTLAYVPFLAPRSELVWVSRDGVEAPLDVGPRKAFDGVAVSPEGDRLALSAVAADGSATMWLYDLRQRTLTPFATGAVLTHRPRWTPNGVGIVVVSDRGSKAGIRSLWQEPVEGGDTARVLVRSARHAQEAALSPDGRWLAYREGYDDGRTFRDIRFVRLGADTTSRPFAATAANEQNPAFSPDGRWLAYVSNETGRDEVYVAPFPGPGGRVAVSSEGGREPVWARSGRELYFRAPDGHLMAVGVGGGPRLGITERRTLFDASRYFTAAYYTTYDVAADGRFLFIKPPPDPGVQVIVGWSAEIASRLTARR
jgi:serine/threonine-protein kinase